MATLIYHRISVYMLAFSIAVLFFTNLGLGLLAASAVFDVYLFVRDNKLARFKNYVLYRRWIFISCLLAVVAPAWVGIVLGMIPFLGILVFPLLPFMRWILLGAAAYFLWKQYRGFPKFSS